MALNWLGKVLYGALFAIVLPAALVAWAKATADTVRLPAVASLPLGLTAAAAGSLLLLLGMAHLWTYGGGLPMNAYPPPRYVARGVFRLLPHPIYTGFCLLCAGVSIVAGSASGLWLVSPMVALGCAALVLGYERHDLRERFGSIPDRLLPAPGPERPSGAERLACFVFVLLPWLALYEAVLALGTPPDAITGALSFESRLPVLEWTELIYASAYVFTALAPLLARTRGGLRAFSVRALWAMVVAFPLYLAIPLVAPPRPFTPQTLPGRLLAWERTLDGPAAAFPSFHVIWALLAAEVLARRWPRLRWICYGWAALIAASCVTTGQHPVVDVLGGAAAAVLVVRGASLWNAIRRQAERIANSWQEWRTGPVRVINHGAYAGAGALVALWIAGAGAGAGHLTAIFVAAGTVVVGAALWAQMIEGSPQLLRPYGFYGGLLGGTLGAVAAPLFDTSPWLVLGAFSLGGPWAQALGRLRCLVQGCCHGRPAPEDVGIRYQHPRLRVCRMTAWKGVPLHPTPVYSILWNGLVALAVTRLWTLATPLHFIAGMYFILTGLGRFVEEAWRGEPQTPAFLRLRLYQWSAVASVVAGALMTALGESGAAPALRFTWDPLPAAVLSGVVVTIAMGVDFPESNRRFSRLV
ncbi:MAG: phosphatase PAP2 family protein [Candidatus Solibacter usitatus]|nr:phosphatase PAP2 family protein [Candidatus Solibacter usitatus]